MWHETVVHSPVRPKNDTLNIRTIILANFLKPQKSGNGKGQALDLLHAAQCIGHAIVTTGFIKNLEIIAKKLGGPLMLFRGLYDLSREMAKIMLVGINAELANQQVLAPFTNCFGYLIQLVNIYVFYIYFPKFYLRCRNNEHYVFHLL